MGCEPAPDSGRRPGPMQLGTDAGRRPWPPVDPLWSLLFQVGFAASASLPRLSSDRARRGVSTERGVEMVPCSSKVRFRAARCRAVLTRMLVVVGFALGVGLAAGAAPALVITPCAPGSYSSTGNQPCTPAPPGSFVASPGATSATPCRAGTFQPSAGQPSCLLAPVGSYVSTIGAASATACPTGTTTTTPGATSIADCQVPTRTTADQCKHGGWRHLADKNGTAFKNQGDCVSYVATGGVILPLGRRMAHRLPPARPRLPDRHAGRRQLRARKLNAHRSSRHHHHGRRDRKAARRLHRQH